MESALGKEGKLKAEMVGGKIKLSVEYDGAQVDAGAFISSDSSLLVDALCALIPGDSAMEKAAAEIIKSALKALKV